MARKTFKEKMAEVKAAIHASPDKQSGTVAVDGEGKVLVTQDGTVIEGAATAEHPHERDKTNEDGSAAVENHGITNVIAVSVDVMNAMREEMVSLRLENVRLTEELAAVRKGVRHGHSHEVDSMGLSKPEGL